MNSVNIYLFGMTIPMPLLIPSLIITNNTKQSKKIHTKFHEQKHNPIEQSCENPIVNLSMDDIENDDQLEPSFKKLIL